MPNHHPYDASHMHMLVEIDGLPYYMEINHKNRKRTNSEKEGNTFIKLFFDPINFHLTPGLHNRDCSPTTKCLLYGIEVQSKSKDAVDPARN